MALLSALLASYLCAIVAKSANTLGGVEVVVTVVQWLAVAIMAVALCHGYVLRAVKAAGCAKDTEPSASADHYQLVDRMFSSEDSGHKLNEST